MADVDTTKGVAPNTGKKMLFVKLSSVDSGDTIDVSSDLSQTLNSVDWADLYDNSSDAKSNVSWSGTTVTLDSGNSNTGNDMSLLIVGDA